MKQLFFLATASMLALTSCTSDKNENTTTAMLLPKTISYADPADATNNGTLTFTYNGNKIISSTTANGSDTTTFTYTGDLITKTTYVYTDGSDTQTTVTEYTYADNKLSMKTETMTFSNSSDINVNRYTYTYNNDGTVLVKNYSSINGESESLSGQDKITITNGNITKDVSYGPDGTTLISTTTYEFDNKNNPAKNILGMTNLLVSGDGDGLNNEIKNTYSYGSSTSYVSTSVYTYNNNGYPTLEKEYDSDSQLTNTNTITY